MSDESDDTPSDIALGAETAKYLDDRATESFKRQQDLEESIWRSLPLFTGALIAGGALVTAAGRTLPPISDAPLTIAAWGTFLLSIVSFAVSFFCLWRVVKPRTFDYPADDAAIATYASEMQAFCADGGLEGDELDETVLRELRAYMTAGYAQSARSSFLNNQRRLVWRWRLLNSVLYGFILAFTTDGIIFGKRLIDGVAGLKGQQHVQSTGEHPRRKVAAPPHSTAAPVDPRRRLDQQGRPLGVQGV